MGIQHRVLSFLGPGDFRRIEWRTGANGKRLSARFAFLQVQITRRGVEPVSGTTPTEWLVIEWRDGEARPKHFSLCHLPATLSQRAMVGTLKERWRIERIHEDLKGEVGFDHFEGRSWPGWQHHATLALVCHALLVAERCVAFPPVHPADVPLVRTAQRPARHLAHSLPSIRLRLGRRVRQRFLPRCPHCGGDHRADQPVVDTPAEAPTQN